MSYIFTKAMSYGKNYYFISDEDEVQDQGNERDEVQERDLQLCCEMS